MSVVQPVHSRRGWAYFLVVLTLCACRLRKCEVCYTHLRAIESKLGRPTSNASEVARKHYKNLQSLFAAHLRPRN